MTLYVWNSTGDLYYYNATNLTGVQNSTTWNVSLDEDNYTWNCFGYDTNSYDWGNANWTLIVDLTPPKWSNNISSPISESNYTGTGYQFNVTWFDYNLTRVWIEHNFTSTFTNYSVNNTGEVYYYNYTDLAVGNYSWKMHANDSSGNLNSTNLFHFYVIKASPVLNLTFNNTIVILAYITRLSI